MGLGLKWSSFAIKDGLLGVNASRLVGQPPRDEDDPKKHLLIPNLSYQKKILPFHDHQHRFPRRNDSFLLDVLLVENLLKSFPGHLRYPRSRLWAFYRARFFLGRLHSPRILLRVDYESLQNGLDCGRFHPSR